MIVFWAVVLLVAGITGTIGATIYLPGLLFTKLTRRRWFETIGADLIRAAVLLVELAHKIQEEDHSERPAAIHEQE